MDHVRQRIAELEGEEKLALSAEAAADAKALGLGGGGGALTADALSSHNGGGGFEADAKHAAPEDDAMSVAKSVLSEQKDGSVGHVHSARSVAAIATKAKENLASIAEAK